MNIIHGDCHEVINNIGSFDLVIVDPPYNQTQCSFDKEIIDMGMMFEFLWAKLPITGVVLIFGTEPYSSKIRMSNDYYRYDWIWMKDRPTGHLSCKFQPLRSYENIMVFYRKAGAYSPILQSKEPKNIRIPRSSPRGDHSGQYGSSVKEAPRTIPNDLSYPKQTLHYSSDKVRHGHPTQKPVALLEYLIKTYSKEGGTVLDFCMGVGSTGVAAKNTGREFIGVEKDIIFLNKAMERLL